jgi:hypothetical protein
MRFRDGSDKGTASNFEQSEMATLAMIRQSFGEEVISLSRKVQTPEIEKGATGVEQSQEHSL